MLMSPTVGVSRHVGWHSYLALSKGWLFAAASDGVVLLGVFLKIHPAQNYERHSRHRHGCRASLARIIEEEREEM